MANIANAAAVRPLVLHIPKKVTAMYISTKSGEYGK